MNKKLTILLSLTFILASSFKLQAFMSRVRVHNYTTVPIIWHYWFYGGAQCSNGCHIGGEGEKYRLKGGETWKSEKLSGNTGYNLDQIRKVSITPYEGGEWLNPIVKEGNFPMGELINITVIAPIVNGQYEYSIIID